MISTQLSLVPTQAKDKLYLISKMCLIHDLQVVGTN